MKNDAAARAAAEAARRRAEEEARRRAAEAVKKAAAEAAKKFGRDELSTGLGGALRRNAATKLGAPSSLQPATLASAAKPAVDTSYDKVDLIRAHRAQPLAVMAPRTAATTAATDTSYVVELIRAQRAQQQALDAATASNGITDPVKRTQATADAIAAQSERFKNDPAAARAFAQAIAPQVQGLGTTLGAAVSKHGDDPETRPVLEALAKAADNLGTGGAMALGRSLSAGLPDTDDLYHCDDVLEDLSARGGGGQALTFGIAAGLEAQGKAKSLDDLQDELREGAATLGDLSKAINKLTPVIGLAVDVLSGFQSI